MCCAMALAMALGVARRESICSGGSSGGVAFCQGDWDVDSQGGKGERLATGIVGHFEILGGCDESGLFLKLSRVLCVMSFFFFQTHEEPRVSRRPFVLFWRSSMYGWSGNGQCIAAAARQELRPGGDQRLRKIVRCAVGDVMCNTIQYCTGRSNGTEQEGGWMEEGWWMDGSELGCAAHVKGK